MTSLECYLKMSTDITINKRFKRFFILSVGDVLFLFAIACVLIFGIPELAFAYVDPSVMTYTIQALAGVAVALSAVLGVAWRRFKRAIYKKLNIDENAGKLVEEPVKRIDPSSKNAHHVLREADKKAKETIYLLDDEHHQNTKWFPRFLLSFVTSFFLIFTIGIAAPFEIVAQSTSSLLFGINDITVPMVVFAAILVAVLSLILSCIRGRAFSIVIGIITAIGLCAYIQALFMNSGLPIADGKAVEWDGYTTVTFITGLVWLLILAVSVVLAIKNSNLLKTMTAIVSVVLVVVQSIGLATIFMDPAERLDGSTALESKRYLTTEGMFDIGSSDNVVMFILDTFDNDYLDEVIKDDPSILGDFTGFTWYQDTSGYMIPTAYGLTSILTGRTLTEDDEYFGNPLMHEWYREYNLLDAMKDQGYSVDLYSTESSRGLSSVPWKVDNFNSGNLSVSPWMTIRDLWQCALYRDMPWLLKPLFWFYTGTLNTDILFSGDNAESQEIPYTNNDAEFFKQLKSTRLSVNDSRSGENGSFKLIHLDGSHPPFNVNADGERDESGDVGVIQQSEGVLKMVSEYINQLKALGVYDETAIIVTADHGKWYPIEDIPEPSSPIMLIKPAHEGDKQYAPIDISTAPISQDDLPATIIDMMGGDSTTIGSGIPIAEVTDGDRRRLYYATSVRTSPSIEYLAIIEWEIDGDVQDWNSWKKTGRVWPIDEP